PTTAAAGSTDTVAPEPETPAGPLAEYGEDPSAADPDLVAKALGPVTPSDEASWNIVLASIARANQDLDQATIDKAMECWSNQECDTGTGGDLIMGWADGGGDSVNVWRGVSHMEAILQALTYPEIGTIVSTAANFDQDPAVHVNGISFLIQRGASFIAGYPDFGAALSGVIAEAEAAGIPYVSFSAGYVGLPGTEGALTPGVDYTAVVGEDLCALGQSFAQVLNDGVGSGSVGMLGGTPGNALTLGWQQCTVSDLASGVELVNPPPDANTTTGDTFWVNTFALDAVRALLTTNPDIGGWVYEYSDGLYTALQAYDELNIPVENLTVALRTDEQTLFCDWVDRNEPTYNIWYSAGGNFQSRTAVTAAMLKLQGAEVPGQIVVPHVMRQVTADDCNPDRVNEVVSGTSLAPDSVLQRMFGG
ncbi:MAG: substrate-binding domain-containing protein, partial [Acidimicrobiia bacterium]|nr:substrate-binding domain-containing protein [Acidimicrobiia bacterium]NNL28555.1 substrate-binding domain-containing protein [Acidimicrobiia bacterium]